jgi:hypothetical protein
MELMLDQPMEPVTVSWVMAVAAKVDTVKRVDAMVMAKKVATVAVWVNKVQTTTRCAAKS